MRASLTTVPTSSARSRTPEFYGETAQVDATRRQSAGVPVALTLCSANPLAEPPTQLSAPALADGCPSRRPASFRVPALERAVPVYRQLARLWMDSEGITDESARRAALLVISELMTNAIVHTNSLSITGRLQKDGDWLLVEVQDEGGTSSVPHRAGNADEYGRGLVVVTQSAQALGTRQETDGGRTFWARIALSG
ncbi:ATP-binding protein [Streptomyces sp. NPDC053720]|uniref:ATP-binding protein n=1 Tax=Streptomyces sp. NPDC053720 TaxID=3154855 RepID=UPI0034312B92